MLTLPNGCKCSEPSVFPKNWKSNASVKFKWRIQYYFYPSDCSKPILKIHKGGINEFKDYKQRKKATEFLLKEVTTMLLQGYDPVKGIYTQVIDIGEITELSMLHKALAWAFDEIKTGKQNKESLKSCLQRVQRVIIELQLKDLQLYEVKTRHIRRILNRCAEKHKLSAHSFNHYRAYLMMLFKVLLEIDAVDYNPVQNISKQKPIKKLKRLLVPAERKKISEHFKATDIYFFRFLQCFFHSGARPIELLQVKKQDVHLEDMAYKITVKKGQLFEEQLRPIKNIAAEYWQDQYNECKNDEDYIFGKLLKPGNKKGTRDYITKKWQREVKKEMGIKADLYSLKHLNLDETAAILNAEDASKQAGHTNTVITLKHYLVNEKDRQIERLKKVNNRFD